MEACDADMVKIGASSVDIKQSAALEVKQDVVVERVNKVLSPQVTIDELKPSSGLRSR